MTTYAYGGDPTGLSGKYHYGSGALGIRGDAIPSTGTDGPGYIYPSLSLPTDAAKEYYGVITSIPVGLTLDAGEDSAFNGTAADGTYIVPWDLYEFGVLLGSTSFTMTFGTAISLAGASTTFGLASGTGAVSITPPVGGTVNLVVADTMFSLASGTGSATVTPPALATAVTKAFENRSGVLATNVTGLHAAFFDQSTAATLLAPIAKWSNESLDASGVLVLDISGLTTLHVGQTGWLVMSTADGATTFTGPVTVS